MMRLAARIAAGLAFLMSVMPAALAQHPAQAEQPGDHVLGDPDAPLLIVEYASFSCPHCAHFQEAVWPMVKEEFIDTGRVRWVFRPILTNPVQLAAASTILAECAAEDRFFDAADLLFAEQENLFDAARSGGDVLGVYNRVAGAVGLTPEAFMACLQDPAMNQAVNDMAMQARRLRDSGHARLRGAGQHSHCHDAGGGFLLLLRGGTPYAQWRKAFRPNERRLFPPNRPSLPERVRFGQLEMHQESMTAACHGQAGVMHWRSGEVHTAEAGRFQILR